MLNLICKDMFLSLSKTKIKEVKINYRKEMIETEISLDKNRIVLSFQSLQSLDPRIRQEVFDMNLLDDKLDS